ncbi:MAG TPA: hypothetical protein VFZ66_29555 [Herpetosiphonaceae bacterium]
MNEVRWFVGWGTLEQMRERIPDFNEPIEHGPFLIITEGDRVMVFGFAAVQEMVAAYAQVVERVREGGQHA